MSIILLLILPFINKTSELSGKKNINVKFNKSSFLINFNKSILSKNLWRRRYSIRANEIKY